MSKIKVFVSSPYTLGDQVENVKMSMKAGDRLMDNGYTPYLPLLAHYWNDTSPKVYEKWMGYCFDWLDVCDCVLRLSGESPGADREVLYACRRGKNVFYSMADLIKYYKDSV